MLSEANGHAVSTSAGDFIMSSVLSDISKAAGRYKLLSAREEADLIRSLGGRRQELETALVLHNVRLAIAVASKITGRTEDPEDLVMEAIKAMYSSAAKYDVKMGVRFSTFAYPHVFGAVRRFATGNMTHRMTSATLDASSNADVDDDEDCSHADRMMYTSGMYVNEHVGLTKKECDATYREMVNDVMRIVRSVPDRVLKSGHIRNYRKRAIEAFRLHLNGRDNMDIARLLSVSRPTVKLMISKCSDYLIAKLDLLRSGIGGNVPASLAFIGFRKRGAA